MTNLAIIGAGFMGTLHAQACQRIPGATVTWVADADGARADALAKETGARATTSNDDAIGAANVDAVLVTVPTPQHREVVELAAHHRKHVFCEKPIAATAADGQAMIDACANAGVRLMIGHVVRFYPDYARIKEIIDAGTLGTIGVVRASRLNAHPGQLRPWYQQVSGGVILDMMIHDLDTLRWYFGDVSRIYARGLIDTPYASTADYAVAILRFQSGVLAHLEASWAHTSFHTAIEVAGENGTVRANSEANAALRIEQVGKDGGLPRTLYRGALDESPYERELRHFLANLASGEPFLTSGEDGLRALELALAVIESATSRRPVIFDSATSQAEAATA